MPGKLPPYVKAAITIFENTVRNGTPPLRYGKALARLERAIQRYAKEAKT